MYPFVHDDITILSYEYESFHEFLDFKKDNSNNQQSLIWVESGTAFFSCKDINRRIVQGDFVIVPKGMKFHLESKDHNYKVMVIIFRHSAFSKLNGDDEFLRAFYPENVCIYNCADLKNNFLFLILQNLKNRLKLRLGYVHIFACVCSIISELDILYDERNNNDVKKLKKVPITTV